MSYSSSSLRAAAAAALLVFSCSSIDNITIEESSETTVPAGSIIDELVGNIAFVGFEGFDIAQSQEFQNAGYSKDQLDSVRLIGLRLEVTAPETGNFDFLDSISFFAEADGQARVRIASISDIQDGEIVLELDIDDVELLEYAVAPSMTITTEATGFRPSEETTIKASVILDVDVNLDGSLGC